MSINISRRIAALEASLSPAGKVVALWAMKGCRAMTEAEMRDEELARRKSAPANARFVWARWMTKDDR